MGDIKLTPVAGMNNVEEDAALVSYGDDRKVYVRDAVNVDLTPAGKMKLRGGVNQVSALGIRNLWQSPLHKDVFATVGDDWVKLMPGDWTPETLAVVGAGRVSHLVLNNLVCAAAPRGIYTYNGAAAGRLTIDTPPAPLAVAGSGSLEQGAYGVAVSWLRGGLESGTSEIKHVEVGPAGSLDVTMPFCMDETVTAARLYMTERNGAELRRVGDYPVAAVNVILPTIPALGDLPQFRHLSPMPTGDFLKYWRGRLITAKGNVIRFSESMAYHVHDERHAFVQLPQRVTFIEPVDGGLWVGQVDHVIFLAGTTLAELSIQRKSSRAPVPLSAVQVHADQVAADLAPGGAAVVVWLAENGYVVGTASGAIVELQDKAMQGIAAKYGTSVVLDKRIMTAVV